MSNNQLHGKSYEEYIKTAFPKSLNYNSVIHNKWDIEAQFDEELNIPTSIKTVKSSKNICVGLADARSFWSIDTAYRIIIAIYNQINDFKQFYLLYEFIVSLEKHKELLGDISFSEIKSFHDTLISYGSGQHIKCRSSAANEKTKLQNRSIIQLNPKIDSKTQRRLQCSVKLNDLLSIVESHVILNQNDLYKNVPVSFSLQSSKREFSSQ